ncbi:MAG: molybdopterin-dependent oxidoreductase, partial [Spirochaetaceae bacterium]|nr:molybdopterin-dependent oxidoreductase [Spirochaetaceae bacterium]
MFVDDIILDGEYFAITIRSPAANCRLKGIRCPPLDAAYRLIQAADIPGVNSLAGAPVPLLADGTLRYIGEPAAIITGPDRAKLESLAGEVVVETETLPAAEGDPGAPVFSISQARGEVLDEVMLEMESRPKTASTPKEGVESHGEDADAESGASPPPVVTGCYRTGIQEHWYSEPHGALAVCIDGGVKVYTATQWPWHLRASVGAALGLPVSAVLLEEADIGLHFDGKIWYPSLVAAHAALAAFTTGKPVKLMLTREEDFLFSPKRPSTLIEFSTRLDTNGEPSETSVNIRAGFGAYDFFAGDMLDCIARAASESYRLGRIRVNACAVRTNLPPASAFAGFGAAEGFFALERHAVKIADTVNAESVEWRGRHYNEKKVPADALKKLIENLMGRCDYRRKWAAYELLSRRVRESGGKISPLRGIGTAAFAHRYGRARFEGEGVCFTPKTGPKQPPLAAAVVELEIDEIDFSAKIRGIWMSVCMGTVDDKRGSRRMLLRNIICALGWTAFEKLNYNEGRI